MIFSLAVALILTFGWIPLFIFRTESPLQAWPSYDPDERIWIGLTPILLTLHMTLACTIISCSAAIPAWRAGLGILVFVMGIAFWFWARRMIGPLRTRRLPQEPPEKLHEHGAFGIVRNPLYLALLVAAAAPVIVAARPILLATFAGCLMALVMRSAQDERRLHAQLGGAYAAYCRQVKRLIPFVW